MYVALSFSYIFIELLLSNLRKIRKPW